jgi:hypothetical protein
MNGFMNKALRAFGLAVVLAILAVPPALGSSNGLDRWAYDALYRDAGAYGSLDPWAYNALHSSSGIQLISEHSLGQHPTAISTAAPEPVTLAVASTGFSFRDAGIGAAVALVATMVIVAAGIAVRRRRVLQPTV